MLSFLDVTHMLDTWKYDVSGFLFLHYFSQSKLFNSFSFILLIFLLHSLLPGSSHIQSNSPYTSCPYLLFFIFNFNLTIFFINFLFLDHFLFILIHDHWNFSWSSWISSRKFIFFHFQKKKILAFRRYLLAGPVL